MSAPHTLPRSFLLATLLITLLAITILCLSWIHQEITLYQKETRQLREDFYQKQKDHIVRQTESVFEFIERTRVRHDEQLRLTLQSRVKEADIIISTCHRTLLQKQPPEVIRSHLCEILRDIRFGKERGFYFIYSLDGTIELLPVCPDYEGQNPLRLAGDQNDQACRKCLTIARSEKAGFCEYDWSLPADKETKNLTLAYVKTYAPLDWVIGTNAYLDDFEADIQQQVLDYIDTIRFGKDGYIFVGDYQGTSLAGPRKNENMLETTDVNGVKIVRKLIEAAREGGGFVEYVMPRFEGLRPLPKISYARGYDEWGWYIGAGVYLDDIEATIGEKDRTMKSRLYQETGEIAVIFVLVLLFSLGVAWLFSQRLRREFSIFDRFFGRAARGQHSEAIDTEQLCFREHREMAAAANEMIRQRNRYEEQIVRNQHQLRSLASQLTRAEEQERRRIAHILHDNISQLLAYARLLVENIRQNAPPDFDPEQLDILADTLKEVIAYSQNLTHNLGSPILYELGLQAALEDYLQHEIEAKHSIKTELVCDLSPFELPDELNAFIFRSVRELAANAVKHADASHMTVTIGRQNDEIRVTVHDNGKGFDYTELQQRDKREGGFGLFSIRERINYMGGRFEIDSGPDSGTTLGLILPREQASQVSST